MYICIYINIPNATLATAPVPGKKKSKISCFMLKCWRFWQIKTSGYWQGRCAQVFQWWFWSFRVCRILQQQDSMDGDIGIPDIGTGFWSSHASRQASGVSADGQCQIPFHAGIKAHKYHSKIPPSKHNRTYPARRCWHHPQPEASLALKLGHSLNKCAKIMRSEATVSGDDAKKKTALEWQDLRPRPCWERNECSIWIWWSRSVHSAVQILNAFGTITQAHWNERQGKSLFCYLSNWQTTSSVWCNTVRVLASPISSFLENKVCMFVCFSQQRHNDRKYLRQYVYVCVQMFLENMFCITWAICFHYEMYGSKLTK